MSNRVVHFEIQAEDPERAAKFYREVFEWEINEWKIPGVEMPDENRYWLVMTAPEGSKEPGINGGLMLRKGPTPPENQSVNAFACIVGVDDIDEYIEKANKAGGTLALPKMAIQGVGYVAYFKDTEGNVFGMVQNDKNAK